VGNTFRLPGVTEVGFVIWAAPKGKAEELKPQISEALKPIENLVFTVGNSTGGNGGFGKSLRLSYPRAQRHLFCF